jgi:protein O-GlcNAc transferase
MDAVMMQRRPVRQVTDPAFEKAAILHRSGRLTEAEAAYEEILRARPAHDRALANYGALLRSTGRPAKARELLEKATRLHPRFANAWTNLTNVLVDLRQWPAAIEVGRKAVELQPGNAQVWSNLGNALFYANRFDEAMQACRRATEIEPGNPSGWNNLGNAHLRQCRVDEGIACYERALQADPGFVTAHSNILFSMHFTSRYSPQEIAAAHRRWADQHEAPLLAKALPPGPSPAPDQRLKVGMISADLRDHPVTHFLQPLVEHWPAAQLDLYLYSTSTAHDATSRWFASRCAGWREVNGLSDRALAERVRQDGVDVLFELTGHTANHRLLSLAYRPAPVQVNWLGYFDTTGMRSVDFLLGDVVCILDGEEERYTERVVRLPHDFVCYRPPPDAPPVGELPALRQQGVTFGSQNQIVKVRPEVVKCWAQIVNAVSGSRLLLAGKAFNDESTRLDYLEQFADAGLATDRVDLRPGNTMRGVLKTYGEIDIALDPFPCAGGTTTCEALWMGVPVVSLYGERFAGRHSAAHLRAVGLPGLVAEDLDGYHRLAVSLANGLGTLRELRHGLRERMRASPLCDGAQFSLHFLEAVRVMWANRRLHAPSVAPK